MDKPWAFVDNTQSLSNYLQLSKSLSNPQGQLPSHEPIDTTILIIDNVSNVLRILSRYEEWLRPLIQSDHELITLINAEKR